MIDADKFSYESREVRQEHLDLSTECILRGGCATHYKGVLAEYLGTTIPKEGMTLVAHGCGHLKCSNPKHMYFGRDPWQIVGLDG